MNHQSPSHTEPGLTDKFAKGNVMASACPSRSVLQNVTSRWGVLVLVALLRGKHRYSELRRKITGISEKMLSQTLHSLEADGFILRVSHPVIPPHVDYSLTDSGQQVATKVAELVDWIEININSILGERDAYLTNGDQVV